MDITTIYWILFGLGLGFAVISAVFAGFGEAAGGAGHGMDLGAGHDMGGIHADTADMFQGHGEIALSPVSPMTIFAFIGAFGGGGLIGIFLGLSPALSLAIALPLGFFVASCIYFLMYSINKTNVSSEATATEAVGVTAEVITPIVEDSTGEIAYNLRGSRYNSPARSLDGCSIGRGKAVKIWRIVGATCYVKEILPEEAEQPNVEL